MKRILKLTTLLLALSGLTVSCGSTDTVNSSDVNEKKIYRNYTVRYGEKDRATHIGATFRVGGSTGTTVKLESPAKVTAEDPELQLAGQAPKESTMLGETYGWSLADTAPSSSIKFTWTKSSGTAVSDVINIAKPIKVLADSNFSLSEGLTVKFDKSISEVGTKVVVLITGKDRTTHSTSLVQFESTDATNSVKIPSNRLTDLEAGSATLQVSTIVEKMVNASSEDLGGHLSSTYENNAIDITLKAQ